MRIRRANQSSALFVLILTVVLMAAGCRKETAGSGSDMAGRSSDATAAEETLNVASDEETVSQADVVRADMVPVSGREIKDGSYPVEVDSSSGMFKITECELLVKDGSMTAVMTMSGKGYLYVFMGTGQEAAAAGDKEWISYSEAADGTHTFTVPVEGLDMGIPCSAFSKNKEKWYDRVLVFRADSLPLSAYEEGVWTTAETLKLDDGKYTVEAVLEGGSGRTGIESPVSLCVEAGKAYATIVFRSPNYDYVKVDGIKFDRINSEGNSAFEIPVGGFDRKLPIIGDTIAMSEPHEIEYTLTFDSKTIKRAE